MLFSRHSRSGIYINLAPPRRAPHFLVRASGAVTLKVAQVPSTAVCHQFLATRPLDTHLYIQYIYSTYVHLCTILPVQCTLGWVKQCQKFEIEHFTGCGEGILPKKLGRKKKYFLAQMACKFAWIFEYLQAFWSPNFCLKFKGSFSQYLKFSFCKFTKKLIFTVLLVVQISIFCKLCKKC